MKQVKFFMVALTLLMGLSLTSCLSGDDDPTVIAPAYGECISFYPPTFQLSAGQKLVLSGASSNFTEGQMYFFYYQFDSSQQDPNSASLNVTLYGSSTPANITASSTEGPRIASTDTEATAPIIALEDYVNLAYGGNGQIEPFTGFSDKWLFIPLTGWIAVYANDSDKQTAELKKHSFILTYNPDDIKAGDTELTLTLNHVISGDSADETVTRTSSYLFGTKAYNLTSVKNAFNMAAGNQLRTLKVVAKINSRQNSLENASGASEQVWTYNFQN